MTKATPKDNAIMSVRLQIPSMRPDKADDQATVTGIAVTVKRGENRLRRRRFCNKVVIRQSSTHISGSGLVTGGHQYPYLGRLARAKLATFFNTFMYLCGQGGFHSGLITFSVRRDPQRFPVIWFSFPATGSRKSHFVQSIPEYTFGRCA
ncbi:MAG: hypothetical protein H6565_12125 [Lewinellaceae bacterium]|nr:hypothetical protein [Lewinellaceae bacterium]